MSWNFQGPAVNQILQEDSGDMATLAPFFRRESESRLIKLLKEDFSVFATPVFFPHSAFL